MGINDLSAKDWKFKNNPRLIQSSYIKNVLHCLQNVEIQEPLHERRLKYTLNGGRPCNLIKDLFLNLTGLSMPESYARTTVRGDKQNAHNDIISYQYFQFRLTICQYYNKCM